ncbi:site-specific DNA-methyltransferase [Mammaliicoccus sp. N-M50]|uniref:site-specific DNA-methyltransferase n=1 Tax=Mammaliicoccus sp. N-M50 TaxID=2898709 RepID=UPI001EFA61B8|nr:site-specific DNA-methyltransferase [Mammaliicoccus sp. N-M50]
MNKILSSSPDLTNENIKKLKELFPEILTDGEQIDFDKLKTILGQEVNGEKERYSFNWHGKKDAILGAQKPSKGTLRPDKEKSKNFDTTENLYIEGDNLEVLKLLQKSYSNKIKMIYIDPPYNTGKDFVYKDNFRDGIENYLEQTGQTDGEGNRISTNSESNGRFHTEWLNMMYSRLKLARNLLNDEGVIFISIDDEEVNRLTLVCEEIFSENNVEIMIWNKESEGSSGTLKVTKRFRKIHEYIIVCYKNKDKVEFKKISEPLFGKENKLETANLAVNADKESKTHPNYFSIENPSGKTFTRQWKWSKERIDELLAEDLIYWGSDGNKQPRLIIPTDERRKTYLESILMYGGTTIGRKDFEAVLKQLEFSYPKPVILLKKLLSSVTNLKNDDLILDFFSGSATTAHATMQLNAEDGGNRKFIMVQLPEQSDEKSEAYKDGYRTICDIGEERIRRAGELVKQELIEKNTKAGMLADDIVDPERLDIGFKVLKLDKSNIREWNSDFEDLEDNLFAYEDVFVEDRSELDVVYEIMLKNGLELTYNVNQFEHEGKNVYDIAYGNLFVCLADNIDVSMAQIIVEKRNEYGTDTSSVVLKDAGFKSDADKLNVIELLKDSGYPEENILTI